MKKQPTELKSATAVVAKPAKPVKAARSVKAVVVKPAKSAVKVKTAKTTLKADPKPVKVNPPAALAIPVSPVQIKTVEKLYGGYRLPSVFEELRAFHQIAWDLNLQRTITMNHNSVVRLLERLDSWVGAHGTSNGERSDEAIKANVNRAFWEKIVNAPPELK